MGETQDETAVDSSQKVGFRDIYRAVGESEIRITAAINTAVSPLTAMAADHEVRIRALEIGGFGVPAENKAALATLKNEVDILKDAQKAAAAIGGRRANDFSIAQKTVVTVILVSNFLVTLAAFMANVATN